MVFDPKILVNIYDLGLVYNIHIAAAVCPVAAGKLPAQVASVIVATSGVREVDVYLVWNPPWTPARMSDAARIALDLY